MRLYNQNLGGLKRVLRVIILSTLVIIPLLARAVPVLAADEQPDTVSLEGIMIFDDLLVTGDSLAFVPYTVSFTTEPEDYIDETYLFRLISPDGNTEIGTVTATPAYNGGYGSGAISFYIEDGLTDGEAYVFRVQQNPSYYPDPIYWDFIIDDSNYSEASDQEAALKAKVIDSAVYLSIEFSVELLANTETGGKILSTYGELYYLDVAPGLQNMCPSLFSVQLESPDYTKRTWSTTFADALKNKYTGTFVYDFMTGYAGLFSLETSPAMNFLSVILFLILIGISIWKFKASVLSALLDGYALLLLLMLMGFFSMIWAGFIAFVSSAIGGAILFFKRA